MIGIHPSFDDNNFKPYLQNKEVNIFKVSPVILHNQQNQDINPLVEKFKAQPISISSFTKQHQLTPIQTVYLINKLYQLNDTHFEILKSFSNFPTYLCLQFLEQFIEFFSLDHKELEGQHENLEKNEIEHLIISLMHTDEKTNSQNTPYNSFITQAILMKEEATVLQFVCALLKHPSSKENKQKLLQLLGSFEEPDFRKGLIYTGSLLLIDSTSLPAFSSLSDIRDAFEKMLEAPFTKLENPSWENYTKILESVNQPLPTKNDSFYATFGKMRDPFAFAKFFATIMNSKNNLMGKDTALFSLKLLMHRVMDDSFKATRYNRFHSKHFNECRNNGLLLSRDSHSWNKDDQCSINQLLKENEFLPENMEGWVCEDIANKAEDFLLASNECYYSNYPSFDDSHEAEGLFGWLLNSQNHILALKDKKTNIQSFMILKLHLEIKRTIEGTSYKPVLIMEPYQSNYPNDEIMREFLYRYAKIRAQELNFPLLEACSSNPENTLSTKKEVTTLEDTCPLEYFLNHEGGGISSASGCLALKIK